MRVVIAHRNSASGHGFALLLAKYGDFDVVAEVSDPEKVVATVIGEKPDLILMDCEFPELSLDASIRQIKAALPESAVAVFTGSDEWSHLESSIRAGASSFVSMKTDPQELAICLRLASDGHVLVATPLVATLSDLVQGEPGKEETEAAHDLSQRELEILFHVAQGATNLEIAQSLTITENTVKVHVRNILGKLQFRNRQQATAYALKSGIVNDFAFGAAEPR